MKVLGIPLESLVIILGMIISVCGVIWKLAKYDSKVTSLWRTVDKMKNVVECLPQLNEYEKRLDGHDGDIKDIKMMLQNDALDRADWRARSEENQKVIKNDIQEMKVGMDKLADLFSSWLNSSKGIKS